MTLSETTPTSSPQDQSSARESQPFARRVGIIGGGQLARMLQPAAINLGLELHVLSETMSDPAAQVIPRTTLGTHTDRAKVFDIAQATDALTFDHEHVPQAILRELESEGFNVRPSAAALIHGQDKIVMRERLRDLGAPSPAWSRITSAQDLQEFGEAQGWPVIVKTARGGYDGKGVRVVSHPEDISDWLENLGTVPLLAEAKVPFTRELAALVARTPTGEITAWPVVQTVQRDGVCFEVTAPAPDLPNCGGVQNIASNIAAGLGVVGVLAVELFQVGDDEFLVNEFAMRPHNSGHWSQDGCVTSQFEQHLRAVAGLPLGSTQTHAPWSVMVNLLGDTQTDLAATAAHAVATDPGVKVHLYGKAVKPGRKVGHVNVCGDDLAEVQARAHRAAIHIVSGKTAAN